jgi:hypothetical protein
LIASRVIQRQLLPGAPRGRGLRPALGESSDADLSIMKLVQLKQRLRICAPQRGPHPLLLGSMGRSGGRTQRGAALGVARLWLERLQQQAARYAQGKCI